MEMRQEQGMYMVPDLKQVQLGPGLEILESLDTEPYAMYRNSIRSDLIVYGRQLRRITVYTTGRTMQGKTSFCSYEIKRLKGSEEIKEWEDGTGIEMQYHYFPFGSAYLLAVRREERRKEDRIKRLNGNFDKEAYLEMSDIITGVQEAAKELIPEPSIDFYDSVYVTQAPVDIDNNQFIGLPRGNVTDIRNSVLSSDGYVILLSAAEKLSDETENIRAKAREAGIGGIIETLDYLNVECDLKDPTLVLGYYQRTGNNITRIKNHLDIGRVIFALGKRGLIDIPGAPFRSIDDFRFYYASPLMWQALLERVYYPYWLGEVCKYADDRGFLIRNFVLPDGIKRYLYVSNLSKHDMVAELERRIAGLAKAGRLSKYRREKYEALGLIIP